MPKIEVTINGVSYPCRPTMGAMLRFKRETGKEATELEKGGLTDLCAYLYCCVASACAADKVPFDMALMDFADALDPDEMSSWTTTLQSESADKAAKGAKQKKR